ncbi:PspC domain-containing protein [Pelagibaculum spongiae]|uniref:Phage shock protein PspC N-terminal domain-containing protein n=1 Tax=Pelagibaculum spongiae TaxID=2080658 RepID=A0A2V1GTI5_9GAMM|nr:PspC domain-containing protein [Pelagibaculum spongiae]PVZ67696.1 hypothetical protein DC094_14775 [Pelagibaculum spongiae]
MARKRLKQPSPVILGVAGVIAKELKVSPLAVRIVMVLLLISSFGLMTLGYFGLWAWFNSNGMLTSHTAFDDDDMDWMDRDLKQLDKRLDRLESWVADNDVRLRSAFRK